MSFLSSRRNMLAQRGRPMTLRRALTTTAAASVPLQGFFSAYRPDQIAGPVQQGDGQVAILNDEITAAGWPGPPRPRDVLLIDGRTWAVQGAAALYDGQTLLGFSLWVRGAQ